ncbi:hypothetical protein UFOVP422_41 [uncultured Caudovirales phage]|uniref:PD-(D/E)XK nuclease superfamily n=1 Tax=uncultured Caudovirales phage TaxID=2100421 RepID=A0A6J5M575_9CAUD|nr:hypothetical protein UFOVP422_41 [uncultured Caudovirales phage]
MNSRWLFKLDEIPAPPPLFRYDASGQRYYAELTSSENVIWYPSVTTVIRATSPTPPGLLQWYAKHGMDGANKLRDDAAERGTEMHVLIADYLTGRGVDLDGRSEFQAKAIASFDAFAKEYQVEPLAIEILLHSKRNVFAGTADLVCRMNYKGRRVLALVDFKSGENFYRDHAVQLEMYAIAWNEHYGADYPIEYLFNWSPKDWRKAPTYNLKEQSNVSSAREVELRSELFRVSNDCKPKARLRVGGQVPNALVVSSFEPDDVVRQSWTNLVD